MLISAWGYALLFLTGVSFSVGGYARLLRLKFKTINQSTSAILALGILCSVNVLFGLLNAFHIYTILPVLFVGLLFFRPTKVQIDFKRIDYLWIFFPALYFLTRFLSAGLPQQHNDALYYHLAAVKYWVEQGAISIPLEHPSFAQATLWETLDAIPMFFLGSKGMFSHVVTQIYGQWMHMFWGHLMSIYLAYKFLKRFVHKSIARPSFLFFLAWLIMTLPAVEWTGGLAKNDYIVTVFIFEAILSALQQNARLTGIFAGFAFATKMSALGSLIALPILFIGGCFGCELLKYACFGLLACFLVLIRNMISTGAPLFPMFDGLFGAKHVLAGWWVMHNASFAGPPRLSLEMFSWIWQQPMQKSLPKILFFISLCGFVLRKAKDYKLIIFALVQFIVILSTLRSGADGRYAAYALSFFFIVCMGILLSKPMPRIVLKGMPVAALLGLTLNSPVDLFIKVPALYWFFPAEKYVNQFHAYQNMKNWMNENLPQEAIVIAIADKANFYLDRRFETFTEMKRWEVLTNSAYDANDFLNKIKEAGYRYVFLQTHFVYPPSLARFWDELMRKSHEKSIHEVDNVMLLDLDKT